MARVSEHRRSSLEEEDREEMSPVITGISIAVPTAIGLGLGLALSSALSDAGVPFEPSQEAIGLVDNFTNEKGIGFDDYAIRGSGLMVVLTVAPDVEIPKDLDPSDLPASAPSSAEGVIDYIGEHLDVDLNAKQRERIRKEFAHLEEEWEERDKDEAVKDDDDLDEEKPKKKSTKKK